MKKLVFAALTAAISVGAAMPASAWGESRCAVASGLGTATVSNRTIAEHCHEYLVGEGIISKGPEAGKQWKYAFTDVGFYHADNKKVQMRTGVDLSGKKFKWKVNEKTTVRTKEISEKDIDSYAKRIGFKKVREHHGKSTDRFTMELLK